MASEGAISSCLCLITCSRVLGECSTFWLRPPFQNGGKIFGKGCLRAGKLKFFHRFSLLPASEFFPRWYRAKMFRNKCEHCGRTRSKSSYVKLGEKVVCRKCYCNLRRVSEKCNGPGESAAASVASTSGEAGMLNILIFFLALLTLNFVLSVFV